MNIIGAGLAGLIAGNMLRNYRPMIHEKAESLPNNRPALLRFKTDAVSKATAIPFKKVQVQKEVETFRNKVAAANSYSIKVTGRVSNRSIWNLEPGERFIAPPDLISQLAANCKIAYGIDVTPSLLKNMAKPIISTIPMPLLMKITGWKTESSFDYKEGWTVKIRIPACNVYQTIYFPDPDIPFYRASITGDELSIEYIKEPKNPSRDLDDVRGAFGIWEIGHSGNAEVKQTQYGKIMPVDEKERKAFMYWATHEWDIYSLGRFATWRPGLLLDDVAGDILKIEKFITQGHYLRIKEQFNES